MKLDKRQLKFFKQYIKDNPHIWEEFEKIALGLTARTTRYSARDILPVMRWHSVIAENGSDFKVTNNISPYLSRLFEEKHPAYKNFFSKKLNWEDFNLSEYVGL